MSAQLVIMAMMFGGAAAAFLPMIAARSVVPAGAGCGTCGRAFAGWIRVGAACPCAGWIPPVLCSAVAAGVLAAVLGPVPHLPVLLVAVVPGVLLAMIDLRCLRLPDPLVGTLAVIAGVPSALLRPDAIGTAVAAATAVGAGYLLIALLPGRGLGLGDVKLGAVLALLLGFTGWPAVTVGFGAAHLINGVVGGWLLLSGRAGRASVVPFGPALLTGALIGLTAV